MSRTCKILACILLLCALACGCGEKTNPEHVKFKNDVDNFCNSIAELDASINKIDATSDTATTQLLGYLDEVELRFKNFADLDFPAEFDYLENLADETSSYMSVAVEYYHNAFSNGSYNEYTAEYAQENYSRAIKRIKIIITFLKGETPDDTNVIISYEGSSAAE
jgi:hypothetical protein